MSDVNLQGSFGGQGGSSLMFRNKIINGNFDVWQRGADFATAGALYTADRWRKDDTGSSRVAINRVADADNEQSYVARYRVLDVAAGASGFFSQRIEDVKSLAGKKVVVSISAKDGVGSTEVFVGFTQNFGSGGSSDVSISEQSFSTSTSKNKIELSFDIPSVSGKTIGDGSYLQLNLRTDASSTCDIYYYQVQLEEGSVASPFEHRPVGLELSLCQRYYQEIGSSAKVLRHSGYTENNFDTRFSMCLGVEMRDNPQISITQTSNTNASVTCNVFSPKHVTFNLGRSSAGRQEASFYFTANAEL
jgi:hypothetical protein